MVSSLAELQADLACFTAASKARELWAGGWGGGGGGGGYVSTSVYG